MKCGRKRLSPGMTAVTYALFGRTIGSTWSLAKMNMFLHGEDNHKIEWGRYHSWSCSIKMATWCCLISWPQTHRSARISGVMTRPRMIKFGRFRRGVPPKTKGDYAFISHDRNLKPGTGRMGVVVPHGVLFRGSSEGKLGRNWLMKICWMRWLVYQRIVLRYGVPAAILIFKSRKWMTRCCLSMPAANSRQVKTRISSAKEKHWENRQDLPWWR